jgi:hypothetical protein
MVMTIDEFLNNTRWSISVKKGGVSYLLENWNDIVTRIPFDADRMIDEYTNDLDTRKILDEIAINCEIPADDMEQIARLDTIFRQKTIEVKRCVYGGTDKTKQRYNNVDHWFYFRLPPERIPDWYNEKSKEMETWREWVKNNYGDIANTRV